MVHASGHAFTQNHCPFNLRLLTDGKLFGGCSNSKKIMLASSQVLPGEALEACFL